MCNLYSETKGQEAIRAAARVMRDLTGNLPTFPANLPRLFCADRAKRS